MSLFLSPYIGGGTKANPYRPTGLDQPGSSAIDIRLDPTTVAGAGVGYALLWLPSGIPDPVGSLKIADDYGDLLTNPQRNRLNNATGLDFSPDTTIQEALETILLRPDTLGWKRLRPANGIYEAWLGSGSGKIRWVNLPAIGGGSISDNFNRANETPLGSPWVELAGSSGDINLSSNALTKITTADLYFAYYSLASGWTADQTSEWLYATAITNDDFAPAVRIGSNGFSGYGYSQYVVQREIWKVVTGSLTTIEIAGGAASVGTRYKISAVGSTIRYYDGGSENANSPGTDSSLTTAGNGAGIFWWSTDGTLDDFLATGEVPIYPLAAYSMDSSKFPKHVLVNPLIGIQ